MIPNLFELTVGCMSYCFLRKLLINALRGGGCVGGRDRVLTGKYLSTSHNYFKMEKCVFMRLSWVCTWVWVYFNDRLHICCQLNDDGLSPVGYSFRSAACACENIDLAARTLFDLCITLQKHPSLCLLLQYPLHLFFPTLPPRRLIISSHWCWKLINTRHHPEKEHVIDSFSPRVAPMLSVCFHLPGWTLMRRWKVAGFRLLHPCSEDVNQPYNC